MKASFKTKSFNETEQLAARLAATLQPGDVVALSGDLGGGKTTFARGLARRLGALDPVTSPTFLLERILPIRPRDDGKSLYPFGKDIHHFDVYRLQTSQELLDLGWEDLLIEKQSVVIVEWAEKVREVIPESAIWVKFTFVNDNIREIEIDYPRQNIQDIV